MIEVITTAPLLTVQDQGRFGMRHLGVPRCGMMDATALLRANLLLENDPLAAGLEISAGPVVLQSDRDQHIVLSGADMSAQLLQADMQTVVQNYLPPGFIMRWPAGTRLLLNRPQIPGQRAVLAIAGGIDVAPTLNSRSTDLNNQLGGYQGRALRAGDRLPVGEAANQQFSSGGIRQPAITMSLRAIRGLDYEHFDPQSQNALWQFPWRVQANSNRTGLRLSGPTLRYQGDSLRLSAGVLPGLLQVPGNGQPILLGCDAQTTGGYPVIASIIEVDFHQLAYATPGTLLYFREVSVAEAQGLHSAGQHELQILRQQIQYRKQAR